MSAIALTESGQSNAENGRLTNHGDVSTGRKSLHKGLGTRLGDSTEVVNKVGLGHTDTSIPDGEGTFLLVGDDTDVQVLLRVKLRGVGEGGVSDLVEGIGRVGDEFSKEDFLVRVEGVDDKVEKLGNLGLEAKGLGGHVAVRRERGCVCRGTVAILTLYWWWVWSMRRERFVF